MSIIKIIFNTVLVSILLTACHENKNVKRDVFRLNISAGLASLDPAFSKDQATMWCDNQLFNGLVQIDEELNVQPCIAKKWTISEDGLTYTFNLRSDVYFHDDAQFKNKKGRRVVAQDFVYSFNRLIDTSVASTGAWLFNDKVDKSNPFEALNDTTFVIHLKTPFYPMLGMLTLQYCSVVPKEVVAFYGKDFRSHPIGTGPFKLVRWVEGNVLVLTKNSNYFETDSNGGKLPYLQGIRISFIADKGAEFLQFSQRKIDFITGLDISYKDKLLTRTGELQPEWKKEIIFEKLPYLNTEYLGISMGKQPYHSLKNKKVRQAINYAIDRKKMIQYLRNGIGVPAESGMIPKGIPCFDEKAVVGYSYNLKKAKQLLIEAGFPNGKGLSEIKIYSNPTYSDLITNIANELSSIGIKCVIENVPASFLREAMRKNEAPFFRASWIGDYPDGENYLTLFYSKNGAPPNYTYFKNEKFDALYEASLKETSVQKSYTLYHEMEKIILDEAPVVPLFYDEVTRFVHKYISGFKPNAMNMLMLKETKIELE
ncbi:MAG TPA: ABC transporter substrate-binding protein [Chitinophagales bacterium]|jgi:oligopeptide transport system substrate-binding protein|nr:ABC transporter substrate-binding protein [Chitinophagales bacterium]MBP6154673.1 ABC transporter substrate-binding protein [Chitinophagales bacterium]HQV77484.1 ABC transporter substrate-binding protein [Chitinophagales bacterium]HQW78546.1 ABC transporter substrate-binding protein [Chitinophagales bacterium]HRB67523.1 ABC transporter substrate-binding protein [Chitinophagales bacterium]